MEAEKLAVVGPTSKKSRKKAYDTIDERRTPELVLALCGAVGSGLSEIVELIDENLSRHGYNVHRVKASQLIIDAISILIEKKELEADKFQLKDWATEGDRISSLQDMGDFLRGKYGSDITSQLFIKKVSANRQSEISEEEVKRGDIHKEQRRVAWILDSLKHPEEVKLLRLVYDKMFSLFGVLCTKDVKTYNLVEQMNISTDEANQLIERDKSEDFSHGQKLTKTLQHGDFFVRNMHYKTDRVSKTIERYIRILIGDHGITPLPSEYAMYLAQSAAFRSGCMSRQVGAAAIDQNGEIISTGFNDVPQEGGGPYTEDSPSDARCFNVTGNKCKNDQKKEKIKQKLIEFSKQHTTEKPLSAKQADQLFDFTGLSDLTEYCRAVHAEMDAITGAARKGASLRGATMFVTTFPCHNCAKHIIASGIKEVYYFEPYEKSLATALHEDSITTDKDIKGVKFLPFEGVAPRQYQNRFSAQTDRKNNGKYAKIKLSENKPAYAQLMDSFAEYEVKIVDCLDANGL